MLRWLILLLAASLGIAAVPAHAAPAGDAVTCAGLRGTAFATLTDAPTTVTSATWLEAKDGRPPVCAIEGYVSPANGFVMWLPATWNGKFLVRGCGGFCGVLSAEFACKDPATIGYACLQTDMGHKSTLTDAVWAYNNPQAEIDFAYRSTHVTTVAGKAIVERFYTARAVRNYFLGCSTGGRQAMVEAQRFPTDFDGIVSIAPAMNETGAALQLSWSVLANRSGQINILTPAKVRMLHAAVVAACDRNDGVTDGLIGDPRQCRFRPASLLCKAGGTMGCLTPADLAVVENIYAGPHDSRGAPLYHGGALFGSELNWIPSYVNDGDKAGTYGAMMQEFWRYLGFASDPGPEWTLDRLDFDRDPQRTGAMEALYSGTDADLRGFKAAGGKLLFAHGWADESIVPGQTLDYYRQATRAMGGAAGTTDFFRLFMVPGMNHCTGGEGAYAIDYLTALEAWVEQGRAPDRLAGAHPKDGIAIPYLGVGLNLPDGQVTFRREFAASSAEPEGSRRR